MSTSTNETIPETTPEPVMTKGMYLTKLYNYFKTIIKNDEELKEFFSLFENIDNIEDVVYMISLIFPPGELSKKSLKSIINGYGINISEAKFIEFFPIIQEFLTSFRSV